MINHITLFLFIFLLISSNEPAFSQETNQTKRAWMLYKQGKLGEAEIIFKNTLKKEQNNASLWEGLLWILYNQKKYKEILKLSREAQKYLPKEKYYLIYGWTYYQYNAFDKAQNFFNKLLTKKKKEALIGLFWTNKQLNQCGIFYKQYGLQIPEEIKDNLFLCIAKENLKREPQKTLNFLKKIKNRKKYQKDINKVKFLALLELNNKKAKDLLINFQELEDLIPNEIDKKGLIYGKESFIEISSIGRKRKGKKGEGEVEEILFPKILLNYHFKKFFLNFSAEKFYLTNNEKKDTYQVLKINFFKLNNKFPYYNNKISLGLEPINAQIKEKFTFLIEQRINSMKFSIFKKLVKDSLLSTCGEKYKHLKWGRVYKTGIKITLQKNFENKNFSLEMGINRYKGKNTIENKEYWFNGTIGKNFFYKEYNLWSGFFVFLTHFEKNTNFFRAVLKDEEGKYYLPAFGHGGYFSPKYLLAFGPSISLQGKDNQKLLWNISYSVSLSFFQTDDSYLWPQKKGIFPRILPLEIKNKFSWLEKLPPKGFRLKGDTSSTIGTNFKANLLYLLNDYLALGANISYQRSADFYELQAGLRLRFYWDKRIKLYYSPVTLSP